MYRSWAYILMMVATLIGVVALLWPSPQVQTIEEIAMTREAAPRAETPARQAKPVKPAQGARQAAKPAAAVPAPPAVLKRMPAQNTTTKRAGPMIQNGMEPAMVITPPAEAVPGAPPATPPPPTAGAPVTARPLLQPRPPAPARPGAPPMNPFRTKPK